MVQETGSPRYTNPAVIFEGDREKASQVRLIDPKEIQKRIGEELFAVFMKCFNGTDRVITLENMILMNKEKYPYEDSIVYTRNLQVIVLLMAGTLYELGDALQKLCNAKVIDMMEDKSHWDKLNAIRKEWTSHQFLSRVRNNLSFHLGEIDDYAKGINKMISEGREFILTKNDDPYRHMGSFILSWQVLYAGIDITDDEFRSCLEITRKTHENLPKCLVEVFSEVIKRVGIQVIDDRKESKGKDKLT